MHLLVIEDEQRLATLLRRMLTEEGHVVDLAFDGTTGYSLAARNAHDLVILDLMLPEMDGLEVCRRLRADRVTVPILMLTARGSLEDRVAGLNSGADDYLVKPFAMKELLARVQALLRRSAGTENAPHLLRLADLELDLLRREARRGGRTIELTAKEFSLLEFFMRHPGQVLTRTQILDHVWSYDADNVSNVVDIYVHYLRDKIDRGHERPLIKTVRGMGYKMQAS